MKKLIVPIAFLVSVIAGASDGTQPCSVTISAPKRGVQVHAPRILVHGEATIPAEGHLWVLAHARGLKKWWPQGGGEADVKDGQWDVLVTLGNPDELGLFDIVAVVVDKQSNAELNRWVEEAPAHDYPPTGFPTQLEGCTFKEVAVEKVSG